MKMMGRKSKGLLFSMGMYAVILTEAAACQCLAEDIPADIPNVKIEYVPLRAADHIEMVQRIHATDNEQAAESGLLFSKEDTEALQRIAMAEAEGENVYGKAAVMEVVLNRVDDDRYPNNIHDVLFQEGQFETVKKGGRYWTLTPNADCLLALTLVEGGLDFANGALYFNCCNFQESHMTYLFKLGNHTFYK